MKRGTINSAHGLLLLIAAMGVSGCGLPGDPGRSFVAIDWVYTPQAMVFPAFPAVITAGEYVEHSSGSYSGEYIAWDGSYWRADYIITVEAGGEAPLVGTGDHGDDYYHSLWLYSFGPDLSTDSIVRRGAAGPTKIHAMANGEADALRLISRARRQAEGQEPRVEEARFQRGPVTVDVTFSGYPQTDRVDAEAPR